MKPGDLEERKRALLSLTALVKTRLSSDAIPNWLARRLPGQDQVRLE